MGLQFEKLGASGDGQSAEPEFFRQRLDLLGRPVLIGGRRCVPSTQKLLPDNGRFAAS